MFLALDFGNTNLAAGLFEGDELVGHWRMATRRDATSDELAAFLFGALQMRGWQFSQIQNAALCSVVPSLTPQAVILCREYLNCEAVVADADSTGLKNLYQPPQAVGADRLVNALAAWKMAPGGAIIADFGTATTIDAVAPDGTYLGGAIAPGIGISSDALFRAAARLPRVELKAPTRTLALSTTESIQAGLVFGYAGLCKELIARARADFVADWKTEPAIYATGGLAELIAPLVPAIERIEPHLTLTGLRLLGNFKSERRTRRNSPV